jgi:RNA polymerase sigma factor (sigma-70 family)
VDDDPLYLRSIRRAFRTCNDLDLTLLPDAGSALDYVDREDPDMVVLDVYMPGMDGVEACRRLRSLAKDTVIVLASCEMTSELRKLSLAAGASFALAKPYDLEQLIEGSQAMRDAVRARLIASHLALALNVAAPLARRFDHLMTAADVESLARLGLCQAAARFDLRRPEPFIAFAARRIRGAVLDEVRRLIGRTRTARTRVAEVVRLQPEWPSEDPTPDAAFERAAILHRLARARSVLSPLESAIVERHYSEDLPLRAIASALGLELTDVQKLHTRALAKLRRAIEGAQRS